MFIEITAFRFLTTIKIMKRIEFNLGCKTPESMISFYMEEFKGRPRYLNMRGKRMVEILSFCLEKLDEKHHVLARKAEAAIDKILINEQNKTNGKSLS